MTELQQIERAVREPLLQPIDRVSEMIFGLFMALTFVGVVSMATADREEISTMLVAALGCNLAWGLVDAFMYLVRTLTDRGRLLTLTRSIRDADAEGGRGMLQGALSAPVAKLMTTTEIEAMRGRLLALADMPVRPRLQRVDLSRGPALRFHRRSAQRIVRVAHDRGGDDVPGRARPWPLRRLWQLEDRLHDGRPGHGGDRRRRRARWMSAACFRVGTPRTMDRPCKRRRSWPTIA